MGTVIESHAPNPGRPARPALFDDTMVYKSVRASRCCDIDEKMRREFGELAEAGRILGFPLRSGDGRKRRVSLIAPNPGEGLVTEPTPAIRPWRGEPLFVPQSRP